MNWLQKWFYLRREERLDRERARNNTWLEEYSEDMKKTLRGDVFEDE